MRIKYSITEDTGAPVILLDSERRTRMMSVVDDGIIPRYLAVSSVQTSRIEKPTPSPITSAGKDCSKEERRKKSNSKEDNSSTIPPTSYGSVPINHNTELGTEKEPLVTIRSSSNSHESI